MEKVTINNEVVLMRKFVKQAKIRAINGYTKEIRKLQNRKGSDDATSKFKRKAERLLAKVAILRKIHPDTVSRKALVKEKDWLAVLKEKNIPLEDQCYALLANYAAVQSEVERFHKKYWDLVPKISTFFKDWEEKSKDPMTKQEKKKAKQLRKSMKSVKLDKNNPNAIPVGAINDDAIKNISTNKNAETNVNIPRELTAADPKQSTNELDRNHSKVMSSTVAENNAVIKEVTSNKSTKESEVVLDFQNKSHLQVKHKQLEQARNLLNKEEKIEDNKLKSDIKRKWPKKTNSSKPVQENKVKAVARLNLDELLGLDEFPVAKANDTVEETSETKSRKDSFFLGSNGEVISESEDEDSPNPLQAKDKPPFKKGKTDDFGRNSIKDSFKKSCPANSLQNSRSSFKGKDFPKNQIRNFEDGDNSFKNRGQRRLDLKNKGFQNKSFGERIPSKQFKPNARAEPRNKDNYQKNKTDNSSSKNPVDDKPLHPSWEAKKKLKEAASSKFQGKRIVFDD